MFAAITVAQDTHLQCIQKCFQKFVDCYTSVWTCNCTPPYDTEEYPFFVSGHCGRHPAASPAQILQEHLRLRHGWSVSAIKGLSNLWKRHIVSLEMLVRFLFLVQREFQSFSTFVFSHIRDSDWFQYCSEIFMLVHFYFSTAAGGCTNCTQIKIVLTFQDVQNHKIW